jgi:CheY-like chemotaxis protein
MKCHDILIVDEDTTQLPAFIDLLEQNGYDVVQVANWRLLGEPDCISVKPDVLLLDLMMPHWHLEPERVLAGYATGVTVYTDIISKCLPDIPFFIYTAADLEIPDMHDAVSTLRKYPSFRGAYGKDKPAAMLAELGKLKSGNV